MGERDIGAFASLSCLPLKVRLVMIHSLQLKVSNSHNINILEEAWLYFEYGFCKLPFVLVELVWFLQHGFWRCHQNIVAVSFSAFYCSHKEVRCGSFHRFSLIERFFSLHHC